MKNIQIRQVQKFAQQLLAADDDSKRAAICLANLARPGNSLVASESLNVLLDALDSSKPSVTKQSAAWALASLATYASAGDLSNRIVPTLIRVLEESDLSDATVDVARHAYQSLNQIGTPDAVMATEAWRDRMKNLSRQSKIKG